MISFKLYEKKARETDGFPAEYYYVDTSHPRFVMQCHWHREWEFIYVISGSAEFTIDNVTFQAFGGDALIVPSGCLHAGVPEADCIYECLVFDLPMIYSGSKDLRTYLAPFLQYELRPFFYFDHTENGDICRTIHDAMLACKGEGGMLSDGERLIAVGSVTQLFGFLLREGFYTDILPGNESGFGRSVQLKSVLEYIEHHFDQPITLQTLSDLAGLNPRYFCQVFKAVTHYTPIDYLVFFRLEQSCILLASTHNSITDICLQCGFNDSGYFARRFRAQYGMTPKEYRKATNTDALRKSQKAKES